MQETLVKRELKEKGREIVLMEMPHGFVTNVGGFNAATRALKASGAFLTERLGSTAR